MPVDDAEPPDTAFAEASAWAFRLEEAPHDEGLQAEFAEWLARSDGNRLAWQATSRAWHLSAMVEGNRPGRPAPRRRLAAQLIGAAAALLLLVAWPAVELGLLADYQTATAQSRHIVLEDGSFVELAGGSAIALDFDAGARRISLLKGEIFLEVVADPRRPFSVRAGSLEATVVGTSFDVALTDRSFTVAVATGAVRVSRDGAPGDTVQLAPGEGVVFDRAGHASRRLATPAQSVAAWRRGQLVFEDAPLMDVVETLQRYEGGAIVVASADLRSKRVTGVYQASDPVGSLRILAGPYGGHVRTVSPYLTIVSRY